ncbi:hypothetical protein ACHAQJ_004820 [Trichoderma viride]
MAVSDWDDPLKALVHITDHPSRTSRESSVSDALLSTIGDFEQLKTLKQTAQDILGSYQRTSADDNTVQVLKIFLEKLPKGGQFALSSDIIDVNSDIIDTNSDGSALRSLRSHLVDAILKPMKLAGGKQPKTPVTAPSNPAALAAIQLAMHQIESSDRLGQGKLKKECLVRDGFRCTVSGLYDRNSMIDGKFTLPNGGRVAETQCAHILPFALRNFDGKNAREAENKAIIWWALHRYFPALKDKIDAGSINQIENVMTLSSDIHIVFGSYKMALWPAEKDNVYSIRSIDGWPLPNVLPDQSVRFTSEDPSIPLPDVEFLTCHCRVAEILRVSGIGQMIEDELENALYDPCNLQPDGSTDIEFILQRAMLTNI